jgi:OOP family OmpA-OmpF porin
MHDSAADADAPGRDSPIPRRDPQRTQAFATHAVPPAGYSIPDRALPRGVRAPICLLQRWLPRHVAGARRTEIASLPHARSPLQESNAMSKNKMLSRALFAVLFGAAAFGAQAAEDHGFYAGVGAGQSFVDETGYDDEDTAFSAFGGYQFNRYFALEAGYADLGELEPDVAGTALEASSAYFTAVGTLPFTEKFSGYAKAGMQRWDVDTAIPGLTGTRDDSGTDPTYGVGLQYRFTDTLALRGEYSRFELEDLDVDLAQLQVRFDF